MRTEKNLPINSVVEDICRKHISCKTINGHNDETINNSKLSKDMVQQAIVMSIYGASRSDIAKLIGVSYHTASSAIMRNQHRGLKIDFQTSKAKRLGKMVFTYDEEMVRDYYLSLPQDMQDICLGVMDKDKLILKSKILKHEFYM